MAQAFAFGPSCFKTTTTVSLPKKSQVSCLNASEPSHDTHSEPSTTYSIFIARTGPLMTQSVLLFTQSSDTCVRMLFIDYSSVILCNKLVSLGLTSAASLCSWVLHFLTDRPQSVRVGNRHQVQEQSEA